MFKGKFSKYGITVGVTVILILLAVILTFQITYLNVNNKYAKLLDEVTVDQNRYAKLAAVDELFRYYSIHDIDEQMLSDYIITGYVAGIGDRFANYYTAEEYSEMLDAEDGDFDGIGVSVIYDAENMAIEIIDVMPDTPAEEAGLMPGDLIIAVNGVSIAELGYYGAIYEIKGEEGTYAEITVAHPNGNSYDTEEYSIERTKIVDKTIDYHMYAESNSEKKIGIIEITNFGVNTPDQFKEAVESLTADGAEALIFDLRYNPGGELNSIAEILDYLLPEGPIIRIYYKSSEEDVINSDAECLDIPMAVLINGSTASAAELFSASIKDYGLGKLVGTTTYGKGTMQATIPLEDGSAVVISIAKYNPPFTDNYHGIGVKPDVEVELAEELLEINRYKIADIDDNQLQAAVAVLNGYDVKSE